MALTVVAAAVFCAAFFGYFVLSSATSYVTDRDAVVDTARDADLRGLVIDVLEESLDQELSASMEPRFRGLVTAGARTVIGRAMNDEWFYGTLALAYGGVVTVLEGGSDQTLIDLREHKRQLSSALGQLGDAALRECASVGGSGCTDNAAAKRILGQYRAGVQSLIDAVPDRTNLTRLLEQMGPRFLPSGMTRPTLAREVITLVRRLRLMLLALGVVLLVVIAAINSGSLARALSACGVALVCAAALYLIGTAAVTRVVDARVHAMFAARVGAHADSDSVVPVAAAGAERAVHHAISRALGMKGLPIAAALFLGFGGIAGSFVARRRG